MPKKRKRKAKPDPVELALKRLFRGIKKPRDHKAEGRSARGEREVPKKPGRKWTRKEIEPVIVLNPDDPALKKRKKR